LTEETLSDLCYFLEEVVKNAENFQKRVKKEGEKAIREFSDNNIIDETQQEFRRINLGCPEHCPMCRK